jgi:hypothetical protein
MRESERGEREASGLRSAGRFTNRPRSGRRETAPEHRIDIECTHYTATGARYRVNYLGKVLIESARDPEREACRVLLAKGVRGMLAIFSRGSAVQRARVDIEQGAKLTTIDNASKGPKTVNYRARPDHVEPDERE